MAPHRFARRNSGKVSAAAVEQWWSDVEQELKGGR
jgi:hypothetical protein